MEPRPSAVSCTTPHTLWFIIRAIFDAGGTAGASIDNDAQDYLKTLSNTLGSSLATDQLGIFTSHTDTVFSEFYANFIPKLSDQFAKWNWIDPETSYDRNPAWTAQSTLGQMAFDLVNEFDNLVFWDPTRPPNF